MASVLAMGAHPDDVEFGCGATLARHVRMGDNVSILCLGTGRVGGTQADAAGAAARTIGASLKITKCFEDQLADGVGLLGIIQAIVAELGFILPEVVYTHSAGDLNLDHRRVHEASLVACRPIHGRPFPRRLLAYEVPGWIVAPFRPTAYVVPSATDFLIKRAALKCYGREVPPDPHPRSIDNLEARHYVYGSACGAERAEAFELIREIR